MLLEMAIGDAYGAAFEFVPAHMTDTHTIGRYRRHPRHLGCPGRYTDDTQMSIAIAELMLSKQEFTKENLANSFVNAFKRDPRTGYARGFYQILQSVNDGAELLKKIISTSDKNGAAMRVSPIGFYDKPERVITQATVQAKVTHDNPDAISAAVAVALMVHYFHFDKGSKKDLADYLYGYVPIQWHKPWQGRVDVQAFSCVQAAMSAINASDSLSRILELCIRFGGDTDTTAAIAMAVASCCKEIASDLPSYLFDELDSGAFGADYIRHLDQQLLLSIKDNEEM